MILYVDSSALMRRYLRRAGSTEVDLILGAADLLGTASVTQVEVAASLARLKMGGEIRRGVTARAIEALERDVSLMWEVPVSSSVVKAAYRLCQRHALKGYDAIHLGAAVTWRAALTAVVTLATFDEQLWRAARAEEFVVWPSELTAFK